ncbi:MAG: hypothetical protein DDT37_01779 [Firmicutes bacterium]|nr:hypothetical protein [candidate division NPL-UPA2 bacterium]
MTRVAFYNSTAWRRLSRAFLMSKYYICERCGKPAEIAHHKTHLNPANINNPGIALNPAKLEALCLDCHNTEHFNAGGAISKGLAFTVEGDIRKEGIQ